MQMIKIYHKSKDLIILEKLPKIGKGLTPQQKILFAIGGGIKAVYDAHEIWFYHKHDDRYRFEAYKNKGEGLLEEFLLSHSINIQCSAAHLSNGLPSWFRFVDNKDQFLFNLKF